MESFGAGAGSGNARDGQGATRPAWIGAGIGTTQPPSPVVSRGVKLLLVAMLALGMSLLALFVESMTVERRTLFESAHPAAALAAGQRSAWVVPAYQSVERSLKYAPLFLGGVFLAYFLFEVKSRRPVHLAQYGLVGVAQLIFYLLLLSYAERVGFDWSFLLAGASTVTLLSWNAGWVFQSVRQRWRAMWVFAPLYVVIFALLRLESDALLLGSLCSFAAVATAMYMTRELDWFGASVDHAGAAGAGQ